MQLALRRRARLHASEWVCHHCSLRAIHPVGSRSRVPTPVVGRVDFRVVMPRRPAIGHFSQLLGLTLGQGEIRQILEARGDAGMIGRERLPGDAQRTAIEELGFVWPAKAVHTTPRSLSVFATSGWTRPRWASCSLRTRRRARFRGYVIPCGRGFLRLADGPCNLVKLCHNARFLSKSGPRGRSRRAVPGPSCQR